MSLVIGNKIISEPIKDILLEVQRENNHGYLREIKNTGNNLLITCPYHKNGSEKHPSCTINLDENSKFYGTCHCFTCGAVHPLPYIIGTCFGQDEEFGKEWLLEKYGDTLLEKKTVLQEIILNKPEKLNLDESILDQYSYFHPYMFERHLTEDVIRKFRIGYDQETDSITFPTWDEHGNLVAINRRSIKGKNYQLQGDTNKPVYLLNFIKKENLKTVAICESQFNALTMHTWGIPAVALMGTGSQYQYEILKKSGIRNFILCFDGDDAGDKGNARFIKNMKDKMITVVELPRGKDINDITFEEYQSLNKLDQFDWIKKHPITKNY